MMVSLRALALLILLAPTAWAGRVDCGLKRNDAKYGLIVLSSMIPDPSPVPGTPNRIAYKYRKVNGSILDNSDIPTSRVGMLKEQTGDFEGMFGRLHALKLKAGDYELHSWEYTDRQNYPWEANNLAPIPFRVTAGRVTYIGSFVPQLFPARNSRGQDSVIMLPSLGDRRERDLSMLARMCTAIDPQEVEVSLLDLSPWQQ
jgi:hypothetical protein